MTFKQKYEDARTWEQKVIVMDLYHKIKFFRYKKWSLRKTATYFGVSIGLVSENLWLAKNLMLMRACNNRKEALILLRGLKK